jgi:MFS family permease
MIGLLAVVVAAVAGVRGAWSPCGLSVLSSLNPLSERARGHRFGVTAAWYVAGAVVGGAALGTGCALMGAAIAVLGPPAPWRWVVVLCAAVAAVVSDSRAVRFALPHHPRQVDERWLVSYRRWIYAGGYGVQIGTGFATYIMTAALYLTVVLVTLSGSAATAFWVGIEFGAVRGLTLLLVARARTPDRLRALLARVDSLDTVSLQTAAAASASVAAVAAGALGGAVAAAVVAAALGWLVLAPPAGISPVAASRPGPR